ncbi:MAG: hypothetical protein FJ290_21150 [Planctomycetes bacterium]|nr:hypothetical protein [Planctomycetota bacterium]
MYWEVPCQSCGKNLKVRTEHVGRRVRCPYCRKEFVGTPPPATVAPPRTVLPASMPREERAAATVQVPSVPAPQPPVSLPSRAPASTLVRPPGTNVSLLVTGGIAAAATALFYALLLALPLQKTYFWQVLCDRGPIQYCTMFLSFWAGAILVFKSRKIARQKESILFDMLPSEISPEIRPDNVDAFRGHISGLPCDPRDSFLMNRCFRALDHFRSRGSVQEVSDLLGSQAEIDLAAVDTSYSMVKIFVWAIPILGFIGTVLGIGLAVGGFSETVKTETVAPASPGAPAQPQPSAPGADPAAATPAAGAGQSADYLTKLKDSLSGVTSGLAVAFDTTFLALVMSMLIMFPMSSMRKAEEDMLISVAEYCNENLLRRLSEGKKESPDQQRLRDAVAAAVAAHEAELRNLCKRLDATGETLTRNIVAGWESVVERMRDIYGRQLTDLQALLSRLADERREFEARVGTAGAQLRGLAEAAAPARLAEPSVRSALPVSAEPRSIRIDAESGIPTETLDAVRESPTAAAAPPLPPEPPASVLPVSGFSRPQRQSWLSRLFTRRSR